MLYLLSGIAADQRIFSRLRLPGVEYSYVPWIPPMQHETLAGYCRRIASTFDTSAEIDLLGISFGGIAAIEIAKVIPCRKVIVVSGITTHRQMDWKLRFFRATKLYRFIPMRLAKWFALLVAGYFFRTYTKEDRELRNAILRDADETFLRWAIPSFLQWKNDTLPSTVIHIHGTHDRIFPMSCIDDCIPVEGADHFLFISRAEEVSRLIMGHLQS